MRHVLVLALCAFAGQAVAQETLADIKQDLVILSVELQKMKRELSTTGASQVVVGGTQLDRVAAIEGALARLTAKTEQLEYRIGKLSEDGANRLGDLEFRICELEEGCDIGALGASLPLGGDAVPVVAPAEPVGPGTDALPYEGELAISEEADFRTAQEALDGGDGAGAALLFAQFRESYPGGPLEAAALVGEGLGLAQTGDTREAARRYLQAYSSYPDDFMAPEALFRLGSALGDLGSVPEACVTLGEVAARYPASDFVAQAAERRSALGCT